ncbi:MAG TPA: hypothetical protein VFZ69_09805 [Longimicrobiales bacterium]
MRARLVIVLWGSGLAAACGAGADANVPVATVRDSAGVAIVENVFPDSAAVHWWSLAQPELDIGSAEAEEAYSVYQVTDALRLADGRVVVANGGSGDIRYYAADGTHLHTSGRRGDGPGEFQRPQRLIVLPPDSVLVVDRARITVLDAAGAHVRDFVPGGAGTRVNVVGRLEDGRLMGVGSAVIGESISSGFQRPDIAFLTLTPSGEVLDTLVTVPGSERTIHVEGPGGRIESIMVVAPPFAKSTVYAATGDVLVVATQESPEIRVFGGDGALRRIIRTGTPMPAVTEAHLAAVFERQREAMPAERRAQALTRPEWPDAGKVVPPFGAVEIDDAGNFWFADHDDYIRTPGTWSVHDPDGRLIARVRLPERYRPMHIGTDFVLGVERDELDVEHVRLHRLVKR